MGDIVFRHGQNGDLRNASLTAFNTSGALINLREVGVEITRIAAASRHFFAGCRNFTQGIRVVGHIRHDDEDVHVLLESQILGCGQSHTRGGNTLNRRVVRQVDEEHRTVDGPGFTEVIHEEL